MLSVTSELEEVQHNTSAVLCVLYYRVLDSETSAETWASWGRFLPKYIKMTRGNQRELARAKNQKKQDQQKKKASKEAGSNAGSNLESRRHRDAEAMRLKQLKAEEKKLEQAAGGSSK